MIFLHVTSCQGIFLLFPGENPGLGLAHFTGASVLNLASVKGHEKHVVSNTRNLEVFNLVSSIRWNVCVCWGLGGGGCGERRTQNIIFDFRDPH